MAAEDALEMAQLLDAKLQSVQQIIGGGAGPQGTGGCSLRNTAPSNEEGRRTGEGAEKAQ